jgi:hypothetical protein
MLAALVDGTTAMNSTSTHHAPSAWHTFERDMRRDWEGWSRWERRAVSVLAVGSMASAAFWFGMSLNLL